MADVVSINAIYGGAASETYRHVINLQGDLDTAHESVVIKINVSDYTNNAHTITTATSVVIDKIEWAIQGLNWVKLLFDATTDDEIITMTGHSEVDYSSVGGFADPKTTGTTGDVVLTTGEGLVDGTYDITIWFRTKH